MSISNAKRHHYVPRFYLRRFACQDDGNKVAVIEQHQNSLISSLKSIKSIGYEEGLYDFVEGSVLRSIEGDLNHVIETPFASSPTWQKISTGMCASLNENDRFPIYGFARHLQKRNLEILRFIETENARFKRGEINTRLSEAEQDMHELIAACEDGAHVLFREGALDTTLPPDAEAINVMVFRSPIPLRSSTNPTLSISEPGRQSVFGDFFNNLRTWWLSLDQYWGAFIVLGGPSGFSNSEMPADTARMINRQFLVQRLNSMTVRYLIADDSYLNEDLDWAGFDLARCTSSGKRWIKRT